MIPSTNSHLRLANSFRRRCMSGGYHWGGWGKERCSDRSTRVSRSLRYGVEMKSAWRSTAVRWDVWRWIEGGQRVECDGSGRKRAKRPADH